MFWIIIGIFLFVISLLLLFGGLYMQHKEKRKIQNKEYKSTELLNDSLMRVEPTEILNVNIKNEKTELLDRNSNVNMQTEMLDSKGKSYNLTEVLDAIKNGN